MRRLLILLIGISILHSTVAAAREKAEIPPPQQGGRTDEVVRRLIEYSEKRRDLGGSPDTDFDDLTEWVRAHPADVLAEARSQLTPRARRRPDLWSGPRGAERIQVRLWLHVVEAANTRAAETLMVELLRDCNGVLAFAEPLFRPNVEVHPSKVLGLEKYREAAVHIEFRDLLLEALIRLRSDAVVLDATALLEGPESTRRLAVGYLLPRLGKHPEVRDLLRKRRDDKASALYQSPLLEKL